MIFMVIIMRKYLILFILFSLIILPISASAITWQEYNEAVANVSISAATTYANEFAYSYRWGGDPSNPIDYMDELNSRLTSARKGIKTKFGYIYGSTKAKAGIKGSFAKKFGVFCGTFVHLMIYHASGGKVSLSDYDTIKPNELQRGDIIGFHNHIAVFLDDGGDDSPNTWRVAEASSTIRVTINNLESTGGYRIKQSALSKLDYNTVMASYDFHDRLDDHAPTIENVSEIPNTDRIRIVATDYKHYELSEKSDDLEPENFGIVAYQVSRSSVVPTTDWKDVSKSPVLNIEATVDGNGTFFVFVKDVGGNVTTRQVELKNIYVDKELPTLGTFSFESFSNSIKVSVLDAKDNKGIKEYHYYLDNDLVGSTKDNVYKIDYLMPNHNYKFYYEVVDESGNVNKSQEYDVNTEYDAIDIELNEDKLYLIENATYKLEPRIIIDTDKYNVKYNSSDEKVATVTSNGMVTAISKGKCRITISVGRTEKIIEMVISPYDIVYNLLELPEAYIGEEYHVEINTSPNSKVTIIDSQLPKGMYIKDNILQGIPDYNTSGEYELTFLASDGQAEIIKKYNLLVTYNLVLDNINLSHATLNRVYDEEIKVNYPAKLTIVKGSLPDGLYLSGDHIVGTPVKSGKYEFTIKAEYMNSLAEKDYVIVASMYKITDYLLIISIIIAIVVLVIILIKLTREYQNKPKKKIV